MTTSILVCKTIYRLESYYVNYTLWFLKETHFKSFIKVMICIRMYMFLAHSDEKNFSCECKCCNANVSIHIEVSSIASNEQIFFSTTYIVIYIMFNSPIILYWVIWRERRECFFLIVILVVIIFYINIFLLFTLCLQYRTLSLSFIVFVLYNSEVFTVYFRKVKSVWTLYLTIALLFQLCS